MAIELDLDGDCTAVAERAQRNFPAIWDHMARSNPVLFCHRARASVRLWLRRWAARAQWLGESWHSWELLPLLEDELRRMGVSADEARGCGCASCPACHPAPACGCSGGSCSIP